MAQPVVPESIVVHLGPPGSAAQNVTVPFAEYIKNVASSEIYPTWPEQRHPREHPRADLLRAQPGLYGVLPRAGL